MTGSALAFLKSVIRATIRKPSDMARPGLYGRLADTMKRLRDDWGWPADARKSAISAQALEESGSVPAFMVALAESFPEVSIEDLELRLQPTSVHIVRLDVIAFCRSLARTRSVSAQARALDKGLLDEGGHTPRFYPQPSFACRERDLWNSAFVKALPRHAWGRGRDLCIFSRAPIYVLADACGVQLEPEGDGVAPAHTGQATASFSTDPMDPARVRAMVESLLADYRRFLSVSNAANGHEAASTFCGFRRVHRSLHHAVVKALVKALETT